MKISEAIKEQQKISNKIEEVPWDVWTTLWETHPTPYVTSDGVTFFGDHVSISQLRTAVEWLAVQAGGTVKWKKSKR